MCGIAGFIYKNYSHEDAAAAVRRMIEIQRHRGPDGEGFFNSRGASLGHCRLAIIDLSDAGHQPMPDHEQRYWVTFNGEIYNYLELAKELKSLGHSFRSHSDTEVLLNAYREWGETCLSRLRGMFAFAIWDDAEQRLFAARDRFGIKPFHYLTKGKDTLAFASEIKALLEFLPERRVNRYLARQFLAWNLLDHEASETMIEGIQRLQPAHYISWCSGEEIIQRRYWHLEVSEELESSRLLHDDLVAEFRHRLEESVALHLRSDVPVGTCLSGGLDSSSIVCLVNNQLKRNGARRKDWQHTFSACFDVSRLDERPFIQSVVEMTGCSSHFVFPSGERMREELDAWLWHQDEPVGGTGAYSQFCVARLAREQGIKVLLDGQGADELLAGYRKYIFVYLRQLARARRLGLAFKETFTFFSSREILRTIRVVDGRRYLLKSPREVAELFPREVQPERPLSLGLKDSLGRRMKADLNHFSLPVLLRYEDRNTMAFGVESRVPFLDHPFAEWVMGLAADMRLSGGWTKRILRDALTNVLPEKVLTRKSKLGFSTPEPEWLAGPLAEWLRETLSNPTYLDEVVERKSLKTLVARRERGDRSLPLENMLFRLAVYEAWGRLFLGAATA